MPNPPLLFTNLDDIAIHLRQQLQIKKYILIFAYNGTGKTRLSTKFKDLGKNGDERDTLYFNAFTEDLFVWDNDLEGDSERTLTINRNSIFFDILQEFEMDNRIRPLLTRYADFQSRIDPDNYKVIFSREVEGQTLENIKVSRGEENIFVWCFFLAIAQIVIEKGSESYKDIKYIYIDDPISSLDDNHCIAIASHLAQLLKGQDDLKVVISSHHTLFFNVMFNELKNSIKYFLSKRDGSYILEDTTDTPFFHHVALLKELHQIADSGKLYSYHFNILRSIIEKTASFLGFENFKDCIRKPNDDGDGTIHGRMLALLSHGNYSLFEPLELLDENKQYFKTILNNFITDYPFNPELFPDQEEVS